MNHGIVTAGHEKTAEAALEVLKAGGNAFDAIVAGGFAACAAEAVLASLGGGGFLLAHSASGLEAIYDFFVQTPKKFRQGSDQDFYPIHADFGPTTQEFHIGLGSMATPGVIAGFFDIHNDLGRLPIQEVLAPAIQLCREGVPINPFQQYLFEVVRPIYSATPGATQLFGSKKRRGKLIQEGELLRFPHLAQTLEAMGREGKDLFYRGDLAKQLVKQCAQGGHLQLEDLESYEVIRRKPLEFHYRGHRMLTNPPPSCGGILIAFTLELLVDHGLQPKFGSAQDLSELAQVMDLTNRARLDALRMEPEWLDACRLLGRFDFMEIYRNEILPFPQSPRGTTHLNVIDKEGNVASMSLSNGEGCGHVLAGTDIMLNNMLGEEDINPAGFENWPTNVRMSSMMSPTLLFMKDGTMVAMGTGGSNRIRTAIVQVLKNLVDHRMAVPEAVTASRIHFERDLLSMEPGFLPEVVTQLEKIFPQIHLWEEKNLFFGGVHTVSSHPDRGFSGMGDPRRFGVSRSV